MAAMDREKMSELVGAKKQILDGSLTIWNARLDALMNVGEMEDVFDHLQSPVELLADNCGCGNNCKCSAARALSEPVSLPVAPPAMPR
jgi:hypothetical protein